MSDIRIERFPAWHFEIANAAKAVQLQKEQGIELTSDSGRIEKDGYAAAYYFSGTTLRIDPLNMSFVARKLMEMKLKSWLSTPQAATVLDARA